MHYSNFIQSLNNVGHFAEFTEISKKVGIAWNNLEEEEKQVCFARLIMNLALLRVQFQVEM